MKNNTYTLTYHDGETEEINSEELAILEENVQYVSFRKTYAKNYNTGSCEISANVSHLGLKKTLAFVRQKADYEAKKEMERMK